MEDKPLNMLQKFFEELKAGNPLIILLVLALLVGLSSLWVWQTIHNPLVNTPTPRFSHATLISPVRVLTSRALTGISPETSATLTALHFIPTPTAVATPQSAFLLIPKFNADD